MSSVHTLQPCRDPCVQPSPSVHLCAWSALIGVTMGEEISLEHTATWPVNCPRGCAQPAVSKLSSARALLVIAVGIISTRHLCT